MRLKYIKEKKGISLISLTVTITILLLIAGTITFNSNRHNELQILDDFYRDLEIVKNKVYVYYWENDDLPIGKKYEGSLSIPQSVINPNDGEDYYLIDFSLLENLNLKTSNLKLIINDESYTIYDVNGIEVQGVTYYRLPEKYTQIEL